MLPTQYWETSAGLCELNLRSTYTHEGQGRRKRPLSEPSNLRAREHTTCIVESILILALLEIMTSDNENPTDYPWVSQRKHDD